MKTSRWGVTVVLAAWGLAASMALAGCAIAPTGGSTGGGTDGEGQSGQMDGGEESTDSDDSSESPGDIDLDQFEGLPETFPIDDVPLIDEPVEMGIDLGTGWSVLMEVEDFEAAYIEASTLLKDASFEVVTEQVSDAGGVGVFQNETYQIQISASDSPDNGPQLTYVVILRG